MKVSNSALKEFQTASSAWKTLRAQLQQEVAQSTGGDQLQKKLALEWTEWLDTLQYELERDAANVPANWPIRSIREQHNFIFVLDRNGSINVQHYADGGLTLIDRNLLLALVCFIFYLGQPEPYGAIIAAWLLLHSALITREPFPLIEVFYLFALRLNQQLMHDINRSVGIFVLGHELGHRYAILNGRSYARVAVLDQDSFAANKQNVRDYRLHPAGAIYNILLDGIEPPLLLLPSEKREWASELAADLYLCYLHMASDPNDPRGRLEVLVNQFCVWQLVLRLFALRQESLQASAPNLDTHPASTIRVDSLIHHVEKLAREFDPAFQSAAITLLREQYLHTWSQELHEAWADCYQYAFYTIDSHAVDSAGPNTPRMADGQPYYRGLFRTFLEEFASDVAPMIGREPKKNVQLTMNTWFNSFTRRFTLNNKPVISQLAEQLKGIGLKFTD